MPARPRAGVRSKARTPSALVIATLIVVGAGCIRPMGQVAGVFGAEAYPPAMVLATGAEGEDCGTSVLFVPVRPVRLEEAVARAVASVPEATLLTDVRVERRDLVTGIYNRSCVRVHGSAAKLVRQLVVPGDHEKHQSHHH